MKTETFGKIKITSQKEWQTSGELPIRVRAVCEQCGREEAVEETVRLSSNGDGLLSVMTGSYSLDSRCRYCLPDQDGLKPWMIPIPVGENTVLDLTPYQDANSKLRIPWDH